MIMLFLIFLEVISGLATLYYWFATLKVMFQQKDSSGIVLGALGVLLSPFVQIFYYSRLGTLVEKQIFRRFFICTALLIVVSFAMVLHIAIQFDLSYQEYLSQVKNGENSLLEPKANNKPIATKKPTKSKTEGVKEATSSPSIQPTQDTIIDESQIATDEQATADIKAKADDVQTTVQQDAHDKNERPRTMVINGGRLAWTESAAEQNQGESTPEKPKDSE